MKIIELRAENIKRVVAVTIRPDGNLVPITGKNGQGKTTTLDAIWWALAGTRNIQSVPIHKGADKGTIRLDLGDFIVTRTFTQTDEGANSTIRVETAEGARFPSPQKMLDGLVGSLSFDPLAFVRMEPRAQADTLREFVADFDFDAMEAANRADYAARTEANRASKAAAGNAEAIEVPEDLPDEEIDESAILRAMETAATQNADTERRTANRAAARSRIDAIPAEIEVVRTQHDAAAGLLQSRLDADIADLERRIQELRTKAERDRVQLAEGRDARIAGMEAERVQLQERLDAAGDLPDLIDVAALRVQAEAARATNAGIALRKRKAAYTAEAAAQAETAVALTKAMDDRREAAAKAIAEAALPIAGLSLDDGVVTFNGLPLDQASDAEQLRIGVAIAMAQNPKLRVIRVRDGSLLDEDGMAALAKIADENDCQIWIERVDSSGTMGFVIEDGHVKAAP